MTLFSGPRPPNCPPAVHYDGVCVCGRVHVRPRVLVYGAFVKAHTGAHYRKHTVARGCFSNRSTASGGQRKKATEEREDGGQEGG